MISDSRCKNACACRFVPTFSSIATKLCPDLVSFTCWIVTEFWSFTRKRQSVPDLVIRTLNCARLFTKLCPNSGCSHARLCPIYFAPCPFPNLAATLFIIAIPHSPTLALQLLLLFRKLQFLPFFSATFAILFNFPG